MIKKIYKVWALAFLDIVGIFMSFLLAYTIKFDGLKAVPEELKFHITKVIILMVLAKFSILILMKMYSKIWRFAGITEMIDVIIAAAVGTGVVMGGLFLISRHPELSKILIPRSILLLAFIFDVIFIGGTRFAYRLFFDVRPT